MGPVGFSFQDKLVGGGLQPVDGGDQGEIISKARLVVGTRPPATTAGPRREPRSPPRTGSSPTPHLLAEAAGDQDVVVGADAGHE